MQVYKIGLGLYIRAESYASAKVRAFKVWNIRNPIVTACGQQAPDIGQQGYREAAHNDALYIPIRTTGKISDRVTSHAQKAGAVSIYNPELAALYASQ